MFSFILKRIYLKKNLLVLLCLIKIEYFIFKMEERKDDRRNLFGTGSLYTSSQNVCIFSFQE